MKDGGAVFPVYDIMHDVKTGLFAGLGTKSEGLSLRDFFAGQALVGLLSGNCFNLYEAGSKGFAKEAYCLADAMLTQREK